jgi:hypothetical protein
MSRCTVVALILTAGISAYPVVLYAWGMRVVWGSLSRGAALAELVMIGATAVTFLLWLSWTMTLSAKISTTAIPWTNKKAVWSFFIPFVNLVQPYLVLRDLHDQLAPDGVPEPAPRPRMDSPGGYRSVAMEKAPPPRTLPHASLGAWWWLFIAERLLSNVGYAGKALAFVAALLAVLVVRAVEGRLEERYRRVRHASDEELEAWGIAG